ncbi:MAG TPA: uroporphyrinogen decarboxylase family protein [Armatimonadota bacterium]|nr:uroporphyrinogen decarboxylase family protein [Armatimonadota bacterium]
MQTSIENPSEVNHRLVDALLKDTRANGGLAPVDLDQFWADQEIARKDPFGEHIPQVPLGVLMSGECVYDELGIPEDYQRYEQDEAWRLRLHQAYNDKAEQIIGRRLLSETPSDPTRVYPQTKQLYNVFEAKNVWHGDSWWLMQSAHNEAELSALLDRVEQCDIRKFILPENWDEEKARLTALGIRPPAYRWQRGPVTFATSIYGVENLIFLILDNPDLAGRFRDAILRTMLEIGRVMNEEAGYTPETAPHGFGFADDNCYLLTPEMYEFFAYPILKGIFTAWSPNPEDWRYQHSDSAMGHLLPILGTLHFSGVNFGPKVTVQEIREHMPRTVIDGQLAPFTFSRNEEAQIVMEFLRDFSMAKDQRGLVFSTAGSINNGSRLTGMRLIMSAIQHFGRYR